MKSKLTRVCLSLIVLCSLSLAPLGPVYAASGARPAPNFTLKSLTGKNMKLSEMAGNVVLINFWASWCGPCREEMPLLNALHKKYQPLGFTVLGVNVEEKAENARGFLNDFPVDFPVINFVVMPVDAVVHPYVFQG